MICAFLCVFLAEQPTSVTKEEKIAALEAELTRLNAKSMTTSAQSYGRCAAAETPLEMFTTDVHNIKKNEDLMPCPRRPPGKK